eukprot:TRINITY_DN22733_c0_g1_i2.p1 TRINITY_DN22733_c0_g1~~TRINITY_DN22733_c0_g1_i2.p1  ORF type:complete len:309 (+),score=84.48 TRINITY_DN22733_c0_g1_i2:164-1090(+)
MTPTRSACLGATLLLGAAPGTADAAALRARTVENPALAVPDNSPFDPVMVLCNKKAVDDGSAPEQAEAEQLFRSTFGADEPVNEQIWCQQWIRCIKDKSITEQDEQGVFKAWAPADCKEVCGTWPLTTPLEGQGPAFLQAKQQAQTVARLFSLGENSTKFDCETSCGKFQKSLSTCVAKIIYEPGQVAVMGAPGQKAKKKNPPKWCSEGGTPCVAELQSEHQKCLVERTKYVVKGEKVPGDLGKKCADLADDYDHCKDCPQLDEAFASQYYAFTGGCMQQLHAYWQATHPNARFAALPGATSDGCMAH